MLKFNEDGTISFSIFTGFSQIICLMSTRRLGNLNMKNRPIETSLPLLRNIPALPNNLVLMEQIHNASIIQVSKEYAGSVISNVDGIFTKDKAIYLGVNTADCVPIFFFDPYEKIIGVVHAGWIGTLNNISQKMILAFKDIGSHLKNIYIAIGPHIGGCCYTISYDRISKFIDMFGKMKNSYYQSTEGWHLDIGLINRYQLVSAGVLESQIDSSITCTSCQNNTYFSFRKDSKETSGEMLGVIGLRS